ncbi:hypothetical protein SH449x_004955 [Pirellulaceae bacterium SH449]
MAQKEDLFQPSCCPIEVRLFIVGWQMNLAIKLYGSTDSKVRLSQWTDD